MLRLGDLDTNAVIQIPMRIKMRTTDRWEEVIYDEDKVPFRIIHKGLPSDIYDSSCDGVWVQFVWGNHFRKWTQYGNGYSYADSAVHKLLNEEIIGSVKDEKIRNSIKQVKIPYVDSSGKQYFNENGLSTKCFLLSAFECSVDRFYCKENERDGTTLEYYKNNRIGVNKVSKKGALWTRTPSVGNHNFATTLEANYTASQTSTNYKDNENSMIYSFCMIFPKDIPVVYNGGRYCLKPNTQPSAPSSINVPSAVHGGKSITISWGEASDSDGNLSGYKLERKYDDTGWVEVYRGSNRSDTDTVTFGKTSVQYRVSAYDTYNETSGYTTSPVRNIINNRPPTIDGSNRDLGTFSANAPSTAYVVNDADGGSIHVKVQLDDVQIKSFTASPGASDMLTFTADEWRKLKNGKHTWRVTATDTSGETTVRTITFTKNVTVVEFHSIVMAADAMPKKAMINVQGAFPSGCKLLIEICNNGNDASPTWQDVTQKVQKGEKIFFGNKTKTAASWGVKVHIKLERGAASGDCFITSVGGNFG